MSSRCFIKETLLVKLVTPKMALVWVSGGKLNSSLQEHFNCICNWLVIWHSTNNCIEVFSIALQKECSNKPGFLNLKNILLMYATLFSNLHQKTHFRFQLNYIWQNVNIFPVRVYVSQKFIVILLKRRYCFIFRTTISQIFLLFSISADF